MTTPRGPEDANNVGGGYQALSALEDDFMTADAVRLVVSTQQASIPFLQQKLGIGFYRATKIIDAMEKDGIVGSQIAPFGPCEVLLQKIPENLSDLISNSREKRQVDELPSVDAMPSVFATPIAPIPTPHTFTPPPMNAPDSSNTSIETGEHDPLFQDATEWVAQQTGRASLTDLRLALNIPAVRTEAILVAMKMKNMVRQSGYMPFPQFFEYTPPAVPVAPAPAPAPVAPAPAPRPNPFARPALAASAPMVDRDGNEWTGVDSSFSGRGKVVYQDGTIDEGTFQKGFLMEGRRTHGGDIIKGKIDEGTFREGDLCKGRSIHTDGTFIDVEMSEGNIVEGKGKKTYNSGHTEEGEFKDFSLIKGRKVDSAVGSEEEGEFLYGDVKKGRKSWNNGEFVDIDMSEGNAYIGKGKKVWNDGEIQEGTFNHGQMTEGKVTKNAGKPDQVIIEGSFEGGILRNGTITEADGTATKVINGVEEGGGTSGTNFNVQSEPIKGIRENASFGLFPKGKEAEANRGIERVENLCMGLPIEDQRRIGELHIKFKDRTPPAPGGLKGLLAKKQTGVIPWRALDTNPGEGKTFVEVDPLRLPADDSEITQYIITAAKRYDNQLKVETEVEDIRQEVQLSLAYDDDGKINFFKSLDGIKKIKTAIIGMSEEEKDALSTRSNVLILMAGQNREYYRGSKYRIILSCDTSMNEQQIASYLRGELRRVEQEDAAGGAPSRKPTKKSVPGIFAKTRGKIAGVLAALAVAGGGAAAVHQINKKPTPVDTTPAPEVPGAPKAAEPPKAPEKAPEEAPKAPEKGPEESGEIKKVDLSKIPVGGKVSFTSPEEGAKKGVLKKNSRGKYEPVDAFDFDGDDDGTVIRIQQ